jgi:hypothetical protein
LYVGVDFGRFEATAFHVGFQREDHVDIDQMLKVDILSANATDDSLYTPLFIKRVIRLRSMIDCHSNLEHPRPAKLPAIALQSTRSDSPGKPFPV